MVVIGILAILGGIGAQGQNVAFLVALAFAVAASANLPTILYSLFWRRFTTRGALWSMYGGLAAAIILIIFSPVVLGASTRRPASASKIQGVDFHWFPLNNPGIVSIPLGFFLGWLGTVTSRKPEDPKRGRDGGALAHRRRRREGTHERTSEGYPGGGDRRRPLRERLHRRAGADEVAVAVGLVDAAHRRPVLVAESERSGYTAFSRE